MRKISVLMTTAATAAGLLIGCPAFAGIVAVTTATDTQASVLAYDSFSRTTANGLGGAEVGGKWSTVTGRNPVSALNTSPGLATITNIRPSTSIEAYLPATSTLDTSLSGIFSVPNLTPTTKLYQAYEARRQSDGSAYLAKVTWSATGHLTVSFARRQGLTETLINGTTTATIVTAGQKIAVDFQVTGTDPVTLQARAYPAASARPAWQTTQTDSSTARLKTAGAVGVWDYVSGVSPATTVQQNEFAAWSLTRSNAIQNSIHSVGSVPVGHTQYLPSPGAVYVNGATGSDLASGSASAPFKTITAAVNAVPATGTVVVRAGRYHEQVSSNKSNFTLQSYPGESVWLDGTSTVSPFTANGSRWVSPWATQFQHSSSFTRGDTTPPGGGGASWGFVNTTYPMAAWPDQVFIDGQQQLQVAAMPTAGQFAVDYTAKTLTIGSDPAGHSVTADTLSRAIAITGANVSVRGLGVRGYAAQLPDMGSVVLAGIGDSVENLVIEDAATQAISMEADNQSVNKLTLTNPGMTGLHGNRANNLTVRNVLITGANAEHFNTAPSAGGMKLTNQRNLTITNSTVTGNLDAHGIWLDANVIGFKISGNTIANTGPDTAGIDLELSGAGIVANNTITNNKWGIVVRDTSNTKIYNNNLAGSSFASVDLWQDSRWKVGMPQMNVIPTTENPWLVRNIDVSNNIFAANGGQYGFQFYAKDDQTNIPASAMNITLDGNLFHTKNTITGQDKMVAWGGNNNYSWTEYPTPAALNAALGKTWHNTQLPGQPSLTDLIQANTNTGVALPADVATATGQPAGTLHVGTFPTQG